MQRGVAAWLSSQVLVGENRRQMRLKNKMRVYREAWLPSLLTKKASSYLELAFD
jgi:hypothetical protein